MHIINICSLQLTLLNRTREIWWKNSRYQTSGMRYRIRYVLVVYVLLCHTHFPYKFTIWLSHQYHLLQVLGKCFLLVFRGTPGTYWICSFWRSAWLPKKEPWIKWHLLQRPGYQTTNESDVTTVDKVFLANRWWHELPVLEICKLQIRKA